jgi:hypothetical protein
MGDFAKNLPEIIKAAATSNLGIVALMCILFSCLAYGFFRKSHDTWRFAALLLFFAGCVSFGYSVIRSANETPSPTGEITLSAAIDKWISAAEVARSAGTISPGTTPASALIEARNQFESAWKQSSLADRKKQNPEKVSKSLSYVSRMYRVVEDDSSTKPNATFWADEAVHYFQEIQSPKLLTEALLDKAAIFLEISQLGNNDKQQFENVAREGDKIMTQAYQMANSDQRTSVLRISSRFYYNLARPRSFRLSDEWDNNYLLLAYNKAKEAYDYDHNDIKNVNQLTRAVIKVSNNPPQENDREWTKRLRDAQQSLKTAWKANQAGLTALDQRLSPLDVLGVSTFEVIAREWRDLSTQGKKSKASIYIAELETDSLTPLREAVALLQNSELRKSYGFDLYFDIARAQAVETAILRESSLQQETKEFEELKVNLRTARENAKTSQLDAAMKGLDNEITFRLLTSNERQALRKIITTGGPN